jgi:hypothetical protein
VGRKLSDLGSGLNLYSVAQLQNIPYLKMNDSMSFNYELLLAFISHKEPFEYFPICWSESDQVSNARNVSVFFEGIKILFNWKRGKIDGEIEDSSIKFPLEITT